MSLDDRIREALRVRAARVQEDPGPAWQRLSSTSTSARDARSLPVANGWRRAAVFVTAFAVFAAAGGFAWIALRPMGRPGQSGQPTADPVAGRIIWPERTGAQLAADQASADSGDPAAMWLLDPKTVAVQFAGNVLGWGPPTTYSVTPHVSWGPSPSSQWVKIARYAVPCPAPAPGQPATCPPPFASETLTMTQAGTVGTGGIWSVSSVRASGLDINLQPGDTAANGSTIDGTVNFPATAAATTGFTAKAGLHIGTADNACGVLRLNTLHQSDTHLIQVSVPADTSSGTLCGSLPASFAWAATASSSSGQEPFAGVACVRCTSPYYYGLTVVPILVSIPENTPAPSTPMPALVQPPDWVVQRAQQMATDNKDPNPISAAWVLAGSNVIAPAVGLTPGQAPGREYLVVLHGDFTFVNEKTPVGGSPPTGAVIAFTLDPATHQVLDLSYGDQTVDIPGLQPFALNSPLPSFSPSAIPTVSVSPSGSVHVPGFTIWAVQEGFGSLWVGGSNGHSEQILRLDPQTGAIQHLFPAKQLEGHEWGGNALVIGDGMVWAATGSQGVERIDPSTDNMSILPVSTGGVLDIAFDRGSVWMNTFVDKNSYAVASLDPATGEVTGTWPFTAGWTQGVYPAAGAVWVHEHETKGSGVTGGSVNQVLPGDVGAVTIGGSFAEPVTDGQTIYAPFSGDPTSMNLSNGIAQIDPATGDVLRSWKTDQLGYDMELGPDGSVWFLSGGGNSAVLERLNPSSGQTDVRQSLSGNPVALTVSGSTVWVVQYDGWLERFTVAPT